MRFSSPSIEDAVRDMREQVVERVLGLILSPQYSPILMQGYVQAIESTARDLPNRTVVRSPQRPDA
jgi:ferrochelatase